VAAVSAVVERVKLETARRASHVHLDAINSA
jgi:hypothetical protein